MKKFIPIITTIVFSLSLSITCLSDNGYPDIQHVTIDENGILSWSPYNEADSYWLGINNGFVPVENDSPITDRIRSKGDYELELEAYQKGADGDSYKIAGTTFYCRFDGEKYRIISESEIETVPESVSNSVKSDPTDYGDGMIRNVTLSDTGELKWTEYERAVSYKVGIDGIYVNFVNGWNIHKEVSEPGEHVIEIDAYNNSDKIIARWLGVFKYNGTKYEMITKSGDSSSEKALHTTEELGATESKDNGYLVTALVICAVVLAVAMIVIIIISYAYVKLKKAVNQKGEENNE